MFRDLKEYQEIAKIYAEKVSKPENLEEMTGGLGVQGAQKMQKDIKSGELKQKPEMKKDTGKTFIEKGGIAGAINRVFKRKSRAEVGLPPKKKPSPFERKFGKERNEKRLIQSGLKKKIPTTAEIRAKNPNVVPGTRVNEVGAKGGGKPSSGDLSMFKDKKPEAKPKKMHSIEKKNRARFGDKHVDKLKAKNTDFKAMKKGKMSKDDFIKKYPKSITAQKAAGLRDHTEWDAYDMVLEYLYSTEQVDSLEEANYVMMEMDHQTIGEIVNEVTEALIDENV